MTDAPFTIVADTREQRPWVFDGVPTVRRGLKAGDYSIEGIEGKFAIERKSLPDLVGTLIQGAERFEFELQQLYAMDRAMVIVEANFSDVIQRRYRSSVIPQAITGAMSSIYMRWGVSFFFASSVDDAQKMALSFMRKAAKYILEPTKAQHVL